MDSYESGKLIFPLAPGYSFSPWKGYNFYVQTVVVAPSRKVVNIFISWLTILKGKTDFCFLASWSRALASFPSPQVFIAPVALLRASVQTTKARQCNQNSRSLQCCHLRLRQTQQTQFLYKTHQLQLRYVYIHKTISGSYNNLKVYRHTVI